jgi:lipid-A-disaccharide synthase
MAADRRPKRIFLVSGEVSGDRLGGKLMQALRGALDPEPEFAGLGGETMIEAGMAPLFPLSDVAVMGPFAIARGLPRIIRRVHEVVDAAVRFAPDLLVIIDSPEFTHPIAKRVKKRLPGLQVVDYVSPSVWAWRSGRARRMRAYVDRVLALLPFEPEVYERLAGPECVYVGHPLIEEIGQLRGEGRAVPQERPTILVLPGSRASEVTRLMPIYRDAVARIAAARPGAEFLLPAVPAQRERIEAALASWDLRPRVLVGEAAKKEGFRTADAAIAASGTVTLELALARVPMVACYRIDWLVARFRWLLQAHSVLLPNLVAGENSVPELIHTDCTAERILAETMPLLAASPARTRQLALFETVEERMKIGGPPPSLRAAAAIAELLA